MHLSGHFVEFLPSHVPYGPTRADLAEAFRDIGKVPQVYLVLDRWSTPVQFTPAE